MPNNYNIEHMLMVSYVYLWGTVVCVKYKAVVKLSMIEFGSPYKKSVQWNNI